jgi:predicted branched-subunit amino acid permease
LEEKDNLTCYKNGLRDGVPIMLGYFAVALSVGIVARSTGLSVLQATISSAMLNASAGQFAAYTLISTWAGFAECVVMMFVVNSRYLLMSCALSQKFRADEPLINRLVVAYFITDEFFGLSVVQKPYLNPYYTFGLITVASPAWTLGTTVGVVMGNVLPASVVSALGVSLFGMFLAIIIPPARKDKVIRLLVVVSMAASFALAKVSCVSSGMRIIILTIVIAAVAAFLFPLKEETI